MFERNEDQRDLNQDLKEDIGIVGSQTVQLGQSPRHTFKKPLFKEVKVSDNGMVQFCLCTTHVY